MPTPEAALELAAAGRYGEAEVAFRCLLEATPDGHYLLPDLHQQLAASLMRLGRPEEALRHARLAVAEALAQGGEPGSSVVAIGRHFLGQWLVEVGRPEEAREAVAPSLGLAGRLDGLLGLVETAALMALGREADAEVAANATLESAIDDDQRVRLRDRLRELGVG